jgi:hypothetical protein
MTPIRPAAFACVSLRRLMMALISRTSFAFGSSPSGVVEPEIGEHVAAADFERHVLAHVFVRFA